MRFANSIANTGRVMIRFTVLVLLLVPATVASAACPGTNLGNALPVSLSGTTVGAANSVGGATCGGGGNSAPDASFLYTAPVSGSYTIDTFGSNFDTILYVRNGTCSGAQLVCGDDAGGTAQSQVTLTLTASQTIVIVIDGYGSAGGNYNLHINGPAGAPINTATRTSSPVNTPTRTPSPQSRRGPVSHLYHPRARRYPDRHSKSASPQWNPNSNP